MFLEKGALYIVATPIGNLADMSQRAIDVLSHATLIAAEDTRRTGQLLKHFNINTACLAVHEHNERDICERLIGRLMNDESIALVSDAGTPLLSDPGFHLVRAAQEAGIRVIPIPGPSALVTALSAAGLPTDHFCFEGFLSSKAGVRHKQLESRKTVSETLIYYEAPHRILATLETMLDVFGANRPMVLAREMTKTFETFLRGTIGEVLQRVRDDSNQQKGEMVILLHGAPIPDAAEVDPQTDRLLTLLLEELPVKQAARLAARISGKKKNILYKRALEIQGGSGVAGLAGDKEQEPGH